MSKTIERHDVCFNCGDTTRKKVLVYGSGGTFWRCTDQAGCVARLGQCAVEGCTRMGDRHQFAGHPFERDPKIQAVIDQYYPA